MAEMNVALNSKTVTMPPQVHIPDSAEGPEQNAPFVVAAADKPATLSDITGITGNGKWQEIFRLISQFGIPNVLLGTFLILFTFGASYFRKDLLDVARAEREQGAASAATQEARHAKQIADQREDHRIDRKEQWQRISELTASVHKAVSVCIETGERTSKVVEEQGKLFQQAVNRSDLVNAAQIEALKNQTRAIENLEKAIKKMP